MCACACVNVCPHIHVCVCGCMLECMPVCVCVFGASEGTSVCGVEVPGNLLGIAASRQPLALSVR